MALFLLRYSRKPRIATSWVLVSAILVCEYGTPLVLSTDLIDKTFNIDFYNMLNLNKCEKYYLSNYVTLKQSFDIKMLKILKVKTDKKRRPVVTLYPLRTRRLNAWINTHMVKLKLNDAIETIFMSYLPKFQSPPKETRLTEYEAAIGFTEKTRVGAKSFANQFGYFMEDIYNLSPKFNKLFLAGCDGESESALFEAKNRHDTMKQSMAAKEIEPKLMTAIKSNKEFYLLILVDKKGKDRNIPLHIGNGMTKISKIRGYSPDVHRWVSGDYIYKLLFDKQWLFVKRRILELLYKHRIT